MSSSSTESICSSLDVGDARGRELLVRLEPQPLALDVLLGDVRVDRQLEPQLGLALGDVAAERADGLADHAQVEVEADARDVAGLLAAEQVAGAADLQVLQRDLHAGAELVVGRDRLEPVVRGLGERLVGVVEEVRVAALAATADAAAQLVQLAEPVLVGAVDDQRVRVGDVEAGLDDGRRDEHVELALPEVDHDLLEGRLGHLAVRHGDARLGHELGELRGDPVDARDAVVHEEDLALAQQLAADRRGHLLVAVGPHEGEDRVPVLGRGRERRHLADARDRHLERARDGRRAHREDVDVGLELLQRVLVLDAEALLLVDDHEPEVFEGDALAQEAVGADDHVDRAVGEARDRLLALLLGLEPAEAAEVHGEAGEALG